jgi:tRNA/tmRNA/rRNA uracil-C5-methylase (TrmA/RlmC/RlmD family)
MVLVECPHGDRCAGCDDLTRPYDAQLRSKAARARAAFEVYGVPRSDLAVEGASPIVGYRSRVKLVVSGDAIGLYGRDASHRVVDIRYCRVLSDA